jgi:hypothetical protein
MPEDQQPAKPATARATRTRSAPAGRKESKPSSPKSGEDQPESAAAEGAERSSPDRAELEQLRARLVAARSDVQHRGRR